MRGCDGLHLDLEVAECEEHKTCSADTRSFVYLHFMHTMEQEPGAHVQVY